MAEVRIAADEQDIDALRDWLRYEPQLQGRISIGTAAAADGAMGAPVAVPIALPEPLNGLVRDLVTSRRGYAAIGRPRTTPWLFPGGRPGQPIGDDRLGIRLQNIGLHPRQARSTALFTLAAEIPPRYSPAHSASTSKSPSNGNAPQPETG